MFPNGSMIRKSVMTADATSTVPAWYQGRPGGLQEVSRGKTTRVPVDNSGGFLETG